MKVPVKVIDGDRRHVERQHNSDGFFKHLKKAARNLAIVGLGSFLIGEGKAALNNSSQASNPEGITAPAATAQHGLQTRAVEENLDYLKHTKISRQLRGIFMSPSDFGIRDGGLSLDDTLRNAAGANFNVAVIAMITQDGYANYKNNTVTQNPRLFERLRQGYDPLNAFIHTAKEHGINTWAWVQGIRGNRELLDRHPSWAATDTSGRRSDVYLDFLNPQVRGYFVNAMADLASRRITGINIDFEIPVDKVSYSDYDKEMFMHENGIQHIDSWPHDVMAGGRYSEKWKNWTNGKLLGLMRQVYTTIKHRNRNMVVSYDVTITPDDTYYYDSWDQWAKYGALDMLNPMIYPWDNHYSVDMAYPITKRDVRIAVKANRNVKVTSIIGSSMNTMINKPGNDWLTELANVERGGSDGVLVFSRSGINPEAISELGRGLRGK